MQTLRGRSAEAIAGPPRRLKLAAALVTVALALTACGGAASSGKTPGTTAGSAHTGVGVPAPAGLPPDSKWRHVLDQVQPDGQVSLATALSAFAVAIGPVPGAVIPPGVATTITSGTLAVDWILGHWPQLSTAQRHAVLGDLGVAQTTASQNSPASGQSATAAVLDAVMNGGAAVNPDLPCPTANSAGAGAFAAQVPGIEADISDDAGVGFPDPVYIEINKTYVDIGGPADMYTYGCQGNAPATGHVNGCAIHIEPTALSDTSYTSSDLHAFLIHEMTHCLLFQNLNAAYYRMPAWYVEGVPMWVETMLGGGDPTADGWWSSYVESPPVPLFSRTYSALGFFIHLDETGSDVWHEILPIGRAFAESGNSNAAGWNAAAPTSRFLSTWGSSFAQGMYPGSAWTNDPPYLPKYLPSLPSAFALGDGDTVPLGSVVSAPNIIPVVISATVVQVVNVTPGASGRISLGRGEDATLAEATGVNYCSDSSGCSCPQGSPNEDAKFSPIDGGLEYFSVTGGLHKGGVTLTGDSLQDFCNASCLVGSWTTTGQHFGAGKDQGGAGSTLTMSAQGAYKLDYTGSAPVVLAVEDGSITYRGVATARLSLQAKTASSGTAVLSALGGEVTATSVSVAGEVTVTRLPLGTTATFAYTCEGDALTMTSSGGLVATYARSGS